MLQYVALLVEALRFKPEDRGVDFPLGDVDFFIDIIFRPHCGPGFDSASERIKHQVYYLLRKGGRCVGLTPLLTSQADCLENLRASILWSLIMTCPRLYWGTFNFTFYSVWYTECPGGNVPDFGRMFLKLKYTDITQNTYIRS
jgi:hypothetical protein